MEMWNGLASCCPVVDTDVVGVRMILVINGRFGKVEQGQHAHPFFGTDLKEGTDVALGNDEAVPGRNRIAIVNPERVFVFLNDTFMGERAKGAGHSSGCLVGLLIMPIEQASSAFLSRFSELSAFPRWHRVREAPKSNPSRPSLLIGGSICRLLLIAQFMTKHVCVPTVAALNQVEAKVQAANPNMADFALVLVCLVAPGSCLLALRHRTQMIAGDLPESLRGFRCVRPRKPDPYQATVSGLNIDGVAVRVVRHHTADFKRWMGTGLGIGHRQPKDQEEENDGVPKYWAGGGMHCWVSELGGRLSSNPQGYPQKMRINAIYGFSQERLLCWHHLSGAGWMRFRLLIGEAIRSVLPCSPCP